MALQLINPGGYIRSRSGSGQQAAQLERQRQEAQKQTQLRKPRPGEIAEIAREVGVPNPTDPSSSSYKWYRAGRVDKLLAVERTARKRGIDFKYSEITPEERSRAQGGGLQQQITDRVTARRKAEQRSRNVSKRPKVESSSDVKVAYGGPSNDATQAQIAKAQREGRAYYVGGKKVQPKQPDTRQGRIERLSKRLGYDVETGGRLVTVSKKDSDRKTVIDTGAAEGTVYRVPKSAEVYSGFERNMARQRREQQRQDASKLQFQTSLSSTPDTFSEGKSLKAGKGFRTNNGDSRGTSGPDGDLDSSSGVVQFETLSPRQEAYRQRQQRVIDFSEAYSSNFEKGLGRIESTASFLTGGGGKPKEERSIPGRYSERIVAGLTGWPFYLAENIPIVTAEAFSLAEGATIPEERQTIKQAAPIAAKRTLQYAASPEFVADVTVGGLTYSLSGGGKGSGGSSGKGSGAGSTSKGSSAAADRALRNLQKETPSDLRFRQSYQYDIQRQNLQTTQQTTSKGLGKDYYTEKPSKLTTQEYEVLYPSKPSVFTATSRTKFKTIKMKPDEYARELASRGKIYYSPESAAFAKKYPDSLGMIQRQGDLGKYKEPSIFISPAVGGKKGRIGTTLRDKTIFHELYHLRNPFATEKQVLRAEPKIQARNYFRVKVPDKRVSDFSVQVGGTQYTTVRRGDFYFRSKTQPGGQTTLKVFKGDKPLKTYEFKTEPSLKYTEPLDLASKKLYTDTPSLYWQYEGSVKTSQGIATQQGKNQPRAKRVITQKDYFEATTKTPRQRSRSEQVVDLDKGTYSLEPKSIEILQTRYKPVPYTPKQKPLKTEFSPQGVMIDRPTTSRVRQATLLSDEGVITFSPQPKTPRATTAPQTAATTLGGELRLPPPPRRTPPPSRSPKIRTKGKKIETVEVQRATGLTKLRKDLDIYLPTYEAPLPRVRGKAITERRPPIAVPGLQMQQQQRKEGGIFMPLAETNAVAIQNGRDTYLYQPAARQSVFQRRGAITFPSRIERQGNIEKTLARPTRAMTNIGNYVAATPTMTQSSTARAQNRVTASRTAQRQRQSTRQTALQQQIQFPVRGGPRPARATTRGPGRVPAPFIFPQLQPRIFPQYRQRRKQDYGYFYREFNVGDIFGNPKKRRRKKDFFAAIGL